MTEMRKRIAQAICDCDAAGPLAWSAALVVAGNVIEAMREPTKAMVITAMKTVGPKEFLNNPLNYNLLIWEAMIDEALRDE